MEAMIVQFPDPRAMSEAAAEYILRAAGESVRERGIFSLVLSGGETPRTLYHLLGSEPFTGRMPWAHTHFFWSDERCVPPDNPESNFRIARDAIFSRAPVPERNIHRIPAEWGAGPAAEAYSRELGDFLLFAEGKSNYLQTFDCVLLGVGADGHTASLFPGAPALRERERSAVPARAPEGYRIRERVTLTLPIINRARRVLFLVSGEEKRRIVRSLLDLPGPDERIPASMVRPAGECVFYLDFGVGDRS